MRGAPGTYLGAEILGDHLARALDRFGREVDAVGAHISNESGRAFAEVDAFIEALGDLHRARRREAEFARGFLLQGRGRERRIGVPLGGLRFDLDDREFGGLQRRLEILRLLARADIEPVDLLAVRADEARGERRVGRRLQMGDDRPIFAG